VVVVQTAAAISTVVMAAAVFPDAQRRVQEELDLVLGPGKAPTFEDMKILPQTHAFVLETYRWRPVSVGGSYTSLSLPRIAFLETWKTGFYVHQASRIVQRKISSGYVAEPDEGWGRVLTRHSCFLAEGVSHTGRRDCYR
jgi:hypothetical protein